MYNKHPDAGTEPLFEGRQAFPAFEELALSARSELCFGLRVFDPETRLRSPASARLGLRNWGELVAYLTARGVSVRLLLTDFEQVAASEFHEMTWTSMTGFAKVVEDKGLPANFQAIAALHSGEFGWVVRLVLWPLLKRKAERIAEQSKKDGLVGFQSWRFIRNRGGRPGYALNRPPRMFPATYHQKLAVADNKLAIIGGLDINERRFDDPDHRRPSDETWHDVSLKVEGAVAEDIRHHFDTCWNFEVPRYNVRLTRTGAPQPDLMSPVAPVEKSVAGSSRYSQGPSVQLIRTRSRRSRSSFSIGPRPDLTEIETAHLDQIANARNCLYLETQFLRSKRLSGALARAAKSNPELHLIVLLPSAPDDVAFEDNDDLGARYGEWLQVSAVDRISQAFGRRCGFFALTRGKPGREEGERDAVDGREIAYVHAKVAIADGENAIVSSANLNGRSLRWDTEAGIHWVNPEKVAEFQQELWRQHLREKFDPGSCGSGDNALNMWRSAAEAFKNTPRAAQVVEYPLEKAREFARYSLIVPHDMV